MALRIVAPKWIQQGVRKIAEPALEPGQEDVGLGDMVRGVTKRLGVKRPCRGCDKRQDKMNKTVVFGRPR